MGNVTILVGAQWGDEGKGKWIDILASQKDIVARYQGGNNAGHTLYVDGEKVVLHQIPSGIFQNKAVALTAGVVVNPSELVAEIEKVKPYCQLTSKSLWLSARAHVITPWHIYLDGKREKESDSPIGTTKRGIGPTYAEKSNRTGIRLGHYVNQSSLDQWIQMMKKQNPEFEQHFTDHKTEWETFHSSAKLLAPFVCDAEAALRKQVHSGKKLLLEGAQGALLDIDHGTYPFVTSSPTAAGGAIAGIGLAPKYIENIIGVAKAYLTRVGEGPFPTELFDKDGEMMAKNGHEFGATTGRPRRCGWLDAVALKYCSDVSGMDGIILNKLDILSGFDEIKIATHYQHETLGEIHEFPWDHQILSQCKPVYKSIEGWSETISEGITTYEELPSAAKTYVKTVEELVKTPITYVGNGVNRSDALNRT